MYLQQYDLSGRCALITGAGRGIGYAAAEALAEAGAHVIVTDRDGELAESAAAAIQNNGFASSGHALDVTDRAAVGVLCERLQEAGHGVDILVNNAGIAISNQPAEDMDESTWRQVLDVNLNGLFWCCQAFGKSMLEQERGVIVNVGSMSGFIVNRPQEQAQYNASKAAVHHLTKSLATEWASRGVRVNAVAPTYIDTEMNAYVYEDEQMYRHWVGGTPMNRLGRVEEVAAIILFLASDASSLMTGAIVAADGGYSCW